MGKNEQESPMPKNNLPIGDERVRRLRKVIESTVVVLPVQTKGSDGVIVSGDGGIDYPMPVRDDTGKIVGEGTSMHNLIDMYFPNPGQRVTGKLNIFYDY